MPFVSQVADGHGSPGEADEELREVRVREGPHCLECGAWMGRGLIQAPPHPVHIQKETQRMNIDLKVPVVFQFKANPF